MCGMGTEIESDSGMKSMGSKEYKTWAETRIDMMESCGIQVLTQDFVEKVSVRDHTHTQDTKVLRRKVHLSSSRHSSTFAGWDPRGTAPAKLLILLLIRRLLLLLLLVVVRLVVLLELFFLLVVLLFTVVLCACSSGSSGGVGGGLLSLSSAAKHCLAPFLYSAAWDGSNCAAWDICGQKIGRHDEGERNLRFNTCIATRKTNPESSDFKLSRAIQE